MVQWPTRRVEYCIYGNSSLSTFFVKLLFAITFYLKQHKTKIKVQLLFLGSCQLEQFQQHVDKFNPDKRQNNPAQPVDQQIAAQQ